MANNAAHPVSLDTTSPETSIKGRSGRPSTYRPATAELICARLADGENLTSICKTPGMPRRQTVHQWRMKNPGFAASYARAREIGMESMSDDVLTIADDDTLDRIDGEPNHVAVQRARLQVDTRKFLMAKLAPHVYGDKVQHEHSGTVDHAVTLSDRERMRRLATFMLEDKAAGTLIEGSAEPAAEHQPGSASPSLQASPPDLIDEDGPQRIDEPRASDDDV